ncbi:putative transcription factor GRF family [Helianthus anomalus]
MATCRCGKLAIVRTSWTDNNPGRRFYSCPSPDVSCPGFVCWVDPPMCPRAVRIIPGLLRARNRADQERDELRTELRWKNKLILVLLFLLGLQFAMLLA